MLHLRGMIKIPFDISLEVANRDDAVTASAEFESGGWLQWLYQLDEDVVITDETYEED
jgi:hypothetical protein